MVNKKTEKISWDDVEILFIGAGIMGASLAQAYAQNGFNVGLLDVSEEIIKNAFKTIDSELSAAKGVIFSEAQIEQIKSRIIGTTNYEKACTGKNLKLVVEAATERIDIKKEIFKKLDKLCSPGVVFATNSSSLDTNILAKVTNRPDKVVWMHYFYLPHKNRGGEYAGTDTASEESIRIAEKYMKLGGKIPIRIWKSRKGGAADIIFVALLLEAVRMLEEGYDITSIEEAGKKAYNIPVGFLALMDYTGLPVGFASLKSFSDDTNPEDPVYKAYKNFYTPPEKYKEIIKKYEVAKDKSKIKWVSEEDLKKEPEDIELINKLCERFWAVGFATSVEVVESGLITIEDLEYLTQNAFVWREGPFTLMNKIGIKNVYRFVEERKKIADKQGIFFPVPNMLKKQAEKNEPWSFSVKPVFYTKEFDNQIARITLSNPKAANALDNIVFSKLAEYFQEAYQDSNVKVVIFDTAPIKTFIAGANVPNFIERVKNGKFEEIKNDTKMWQDTIFNIMTGNGKPKIAIIDGQAFGGGVEVAMAFAYAPDTIVIITDRTSYTLPETRLGIFPGLRGTLLLPQLIYRATKDEELAVAIARYYILAGGTTTTSPRLIKYLGMADLIVPSHKRDEVAQIIAEAIIKNNGKILDKKQLQKLDLPRLEDKPTFSEMEELRVIKDLFLQTSLIPSLYAFGLGWRKLFVAGEHKAFCQRIARRVFSCSPNAVYIANWLISRGFKDFMDGVPLEKLADRELDEYLVQVFKHPDALEGMSAMVERRFPEFNRNFPF
ncbi:hypothetical protein DRQ09_00335 [candidate division KSB1 bacterium]|nr:MAG: hypothetical protein DRQ09_00335 [candidate division KSB1 bacterium]